MSEANLSFEQALKNLENIVQKLEQGEVQLEDAIKFYQDGMKYSKICHDKLKEADQQIAKILKDNGDLDTFLVVEGE